MAGVDDAGAAARRAKAERTAAGITDYGISRALRAYFLVYLPAGVLVLAGTGFLLSALLFGDISQERPAYTSIGLMLSGSNPGAPAAARGADLAGEA